MVVGVVVFVMVGVMFLVEYDECEDVYSEFSMFDAYSRIGIVVGFFWLV